jgi:AcrR family transcriptional regulator
MRPAGLGVVITLWRNSGRVRSTEETKRLILDVATTKFAVCGLSGACIDRIEELSGINKRMIYVYFESKENLLDCVLTESLRLVIDEPYPNDTHVLAEVTAALAKVCSEQRQHIVELAERIEQLEAGAPVEIVEKKQYERWEWVSP